MRLKIHLVVFLLFFGISTTIVAQQVGLGGTLPVESSFLNHQDLAITTIPKNPLIRVPIVLNQHWTLEPEFGMSQLRGKAELTGTHTGTYVNSLYILNCYVRYNWGDSTLQHGPGIRLGIKYFERKSDLITGSFDVFDVERNPVVGFTYSGEYFFNSAFSVGGEAQLNYTILETGAIDNTPTDVRLIELAMRFTLRWYFLK